MELSDALREDEQKVYIACRQLIDEGSLTTFSRKSAEGRGAPTKVYCLASKAPAVVPTRVSAREIKSHISILARIDALKAAVNLISEELAELEAALKEGTV